ncbi:MAG TPA: hypothetical protein VF666_13250, partial [Pyrinomonadaceae bacterium]
DVELASSSSPFERVHIVHLELTEFALACKVPFPVQGSLSIPISLNAQIRFLTASKSQRLCFPARPVSLSILRGNSSQAT